MTLALMMFRSTMNGRKFSLQRAMVIHGRTGYLGLTASNIFLWNAFLMLIYSALLTRSLNMTVTMHALLKRDIDRTNYKMLKAKKSETLAEVPACWHIRAKLLRSKPGSNAIKMSENCVIPSFATLHFGEAKIALLNQEGDKIFFKTLDGIVPAEGIL